MVGVPTVELHRHFEAGLTPETVARLAQRHGVHEVRTRTGVLIAGVDPQDPESIRAYYRAVAAGFTGPGGFARFVDSFGLPLSVLTSLEDLEAAAFEQLVALHEQGSLHTELRGSAMTYQERVRAPVPEIIEALRAGVERAFRERGASGTFIVAFSRQNGLGPPDGPRMRRQAPEVCAAVADLYDAERPLGLDIAGFPELAFPPRHFEAVTRPAREAGVPLTIHCGEQGRAPDFADSPPELVVEAIERLGARRIGHGTCLIASPAARAVVKAAGVGVECCPQSNRLMGFVPRLEDHPLRRFMDEGLRCSIGTDDPLMFGDFTVGELLDHGGAALGLGEAERWRLAEDGVATAFVSDARRAWLQDRLRELRAAQAS
jgi:adenosine deaminase